MTATPDISVIVPVTERFDDVRELFAEYRSALDSTGLDYEFIYVLDGPYEPVLADLKALQSEGERLSIIQLAKTFGEATALTVGFEHAASELVLTLPAYFQVEPSTIPKVLEHLQQTNNDMVITRRWPRVDSRFNRFQTRAFHWLVRRITGAPFRDLGCGVRAFKRAVPAEIPVYGDQHRFLPILASRRGFRVEEVDLPQSGHDPFRRVYRAGVYPRRLLDLLTVFFLVKFTKKPLRFFGLIGVATALIGTLLLVYLVVARLFFEQPLADRPALLLSSLLVVLGVQIFALGLLGELIIFTHAGALKEYTVAQILNAPNKAAEPVEAVVESANVMAGPPG